MFQRFIYCSIELFHTCVLLSVFIFILRRFPFGIKSNASSDDGFFLATNPELSGLPPGRLLVPISTSPILRTLSTSESIDTEPFEELSSLSKSQSLSSTQQQELTVDNIEDFDDDDDLDEVDSRRYSRRVLNDVADLVLGLPSFATVLGCNLLVF
ncbi:hypothetical protein KY284_002123 [Solanum tuberosum]|nr:hypothetical protein KY284_002123 [Solanum tuberosum]